MGPDLHRPKGLGYRARSVWYARGRQLSGQFVSSDDYMRGALPGEMPAHGMFEALRAQAIARAVRGVAAIDSRRRTWDLPTTPRTVLWRHCFEAARRAPRSKRRLVTSPMTKTDPRAVFIASGGVSENVGCVLDAERVGSTWGCVQAAVSSGTEIRRKPRPRQARRHAAWAVVRMVQRRGDRKEIIVDYGSTSALRVVDFNMSPGERPSRCA